MTTPTVKWSRGKHSGKHPTLEYRNVSKKKNPFHCTLKAAQCAFVGDDETRCPEVICVALPYCRKHTIDVLQLQVFTVGERIGVFAEARTKTVNKQNPTQVVFKQNDVIIKFDPSLGGLGEKLTTEQLRERYDGKEAPFVFVAGGGEYHDGACQRTIASMISSNVTADATNCNLNGAGDVIATKDIKDHDELIISHTLKNIGGDSGFGTYDATSGKIANIGEITGECDEDRKRALGFDSDSDCSSSGGSCDGSSGSDESSCDESGKSDDDSEMSDDDCGGGKKKKPKKDCETELPCKKKKKKSKKCNSDSDSSDSDSSNSSCSDSSKSSCSDSDSSKSSCSDSDSSKSSCSDSDSSNSSCSDSSKSSCSDSDSSKSSCSDSDSSKSSCSDSSSSSSGSSDCKKKRRKRKRSTTPCKPLPMPCDDDDEDKKGVGLEDACGNPIKKKKRRKN